MSADPTVFVIDDDPSVRSSQRWLMESVGLKVEIFDSAQAFLDAYTPDRGGCLLLDMRMPGMSGLELLEHLRRIKIALPVIVLTGYGDVQNAVRAMKADALDFLEKPVCDQLLLEQIQRALALDKKQRQYQTECTQVVQRFQTLTQREREVMGLVVVGDSSKDIAGKLGISFKTIEAHRAKIMRKMQANSVPHLIRLSLMVESE